MASRPFTLAAALLMPLCLEASLRGSGVTCHGRAGPIWGDAVSKCSGYQIICGPDIPCAGSPHLPICSYANLAARVNVSAKANHQPAAVETSQLSASLGVTCNGRAGPIWGDSMSKCCGASGFQIICGPDTLCAGSPTLPICSYASPGMTCHGRAGPIWGESMSKCCGARGYQIICGADIPCAGSPTLPICSFSNLVAKARVTANEDEHQPAAVEKSDLSASQGVTCHSRAGPIWGDSVSKCCGARGYQIICGPDIPCAGSPTLPICSYASFSKQTTDPTSPVKIQANLTVTEQSMLTVSASGCTTEDETKMQALGSGNADGTFPKILSVCGKQSYGLFSGFNKGNYEKCVTSKTGISSSCAACTAISAEYGANNCKWSCFWGSWCGSGCLSCVEPQNSKTQQCAGVQIPSTSTC
eukprot:TRINITY_DN4021_c0_g2_i1.p1 TRINITY_DN4021_c0_g2~~TRINITY_DN4021_c0_g2_i1.p1  ORF type:complete len:441 (-),score=54.79 TRINITY_DN4021_c0_g2_i1:236-1480(-)